MELPKTGIPTGDRAMHPQAIRESAHAARLIDAGFRIVGGLMMPDIADRYADRVQPDHIPDRVLRVAAEIAVDLHRRYGEVDVREMIRRVHVELGEAERPGPVMERLAECLEMPATPASMEAAMADLRDEAMRQAADVILRRVASRLAVGTGDPVSEVLADARQELEAVDRETGGGRVDRLTLADLAAIDPADETDEIIPTGIPWMDEAMPGGGLRRGDVVLIGGAPGLGKTALAIDVEMSLLAHAPDVRIAHVAAEMSPQAIRNRCLSNLAAMPETLLRRPEAMLTPPQVDRKRDAIETLRGHGDRMSLTLPPVTPRTIREVVRRDRPDVLVLDYLQIVGTDEPMPSRREAVDSVMRCVREIASTWNLVAIVLSEAAKPPKGGDLDMWTAFKESSGLIYAADLAYVGKRVPQEDPMAGGIATWIRVDWECHKARHGERRDMQTRFDGSIGRFEEAV